MSVANKKHQQQKKLETQSRAAIPQGTNTPHKRHRQ